jgi:hypothetical protein
MQIVRSMDGEIKMMNQMAVTQAEIKARTSPAAASGVLQRACARCQKKKPALQRSAVRDALDFVPSIMHEALDEPSRIPGPAARASMEPRSGHDFSHVRIHTEPEAAGSGWAVNVTMHPARTPIISWEGPATRGVARQAECGKKCGGGELGSVECKLDEKSGLPTDKVQKEVREKDPCTRSCVDAHEEVHVKDFAPICRQVHQCLREARGDTKKTEKCLDIYEADSLAKIAGAGGTECNAYRAEKECMTKREPVPECKTKEGRSRWTAHLARTKCYEECYCRK